MFDFPRWKTWLEARAAELTADGLHIQFSAGPEGSAKPGMGLGLRGTRAVGLFENWRTGETDYTIHAPSDGPMVSHRWGLIVEDETFEATFREFIAEFNRFELRT